MTEKTFEEIYREVLQLIRDWHVSGVKYLEEKERET